MPSLRKKQPTFAPGQMVVAYESFVMAGENGALADVVVQEGMRLRADHEAVRRAPHFFVPDGADSIEINRAKNASHYQVDE